MAIDDDEAEFFELLGKENDGTGLTAEEKLLKEIFAPSDENALPVRARSFAEHLSRKWHYWVANVTKDGGKCKFCGKFLARVYDRKEVCPLRPFNE